MDKQKEIFEKLNFGPFPSHLAEILYGPRTAPGDICYVCSGYRVSEPNVSRPEDPRHRFEHDVIMTLVQCGERANNGKVRRRIVNREIISIEIKTSIRDILESSIDHYLGATRLFFVASPKNMLRTLFYKYRDNGQKEYIGLIDSDAGRVVVMPQFQNYERDRLDRLVARCYLSEHRFPFCGDEEPYSVHRVMDYEREETPFVEVGGLCVNAYYLEYLYY